MLQVTRYAHRFGLALLLAGVVAPATVGLMPGLLLAAGSGCLLLLLRGGFVQQRWLQLHLAAALAVMAIIVLVVLPAVDAAASGAPVARENVWLWLAGGLVLAVAAIGYFKPRLR
jgi:hypothetical protein